MACRIHVVVESRDAYDHMEFFSIRSLSTCEGSWILERMISKLAMCQKMAILKIGNIVLGDLC